MTVESVLELYVVPWSIKIVTALAVFIIGRWIAKLLTRTSGKLMAKAKLDDLLIKFVGNIIYTALIAVVVLASLEQLGVNTTSALAIMGAAGLAIGLALKDSLSNFAAGVMLIIFRPFKVGDFIEAGGVTGSVEQIMVFATILRTGDNREVIVPNSAISGGTIVNYSARDTRRIDMVIGIGYDDDIKQAKDVLEGILTAHGQVLEDPAPAVALADLADSSVNFNVRPWVNSGDYWGVRSELLEAIKTTFDEKGISIPYPQTDVHVHNAGD